MTSFPVAQYDPRPIGAVADRHETAAHRADQHPATLMVDFMADSADTSSLVARFSVPTDGVALTASLEGPGVLKSPARICVDGFEMTSHTVQMREGWVALVRLPPRRAWWMPLECRIVLTEAAAAPYIATYCAVRRSGRSSLVEGDVLPCRKADAMQAQDAPARAEAVVRAVRLSLAADEPERAARLLISAMALGLDDVRAQCGADVMAAIASRSEFFASADALKILIAMSS